MWGEDTGPDDVDHHGVDVRSLGVEDLQVVRQPIGGRLCAGDSGDGHAGISAELIHSGLLPWGAWSIRTKNYRDALAGKALVETSRRCQGRAWSDGLRSCILGEGIVGRKAAEEERADTKGRTPGQQLAAADASALEVSQEACDLLVVLCLVETGHSSTPFVESYFAANIAAPSTGTLLTPISGEVSSRRLPEVL